MKKYFGKRSAPNGYVSSVEVGVIAENGEREILIHRELHSPDGFNWGYAGSGPADLARSILWDVMGCQPPTLYYQSFKHDIISTLPDEWFIEEAFVIEYIRKKFNYTINK